jgi:hypothetical protein
MRAHHIVFIVVAGLFPLSLAGCSLVTSVDKSEIRKLEIQKEGLTKLEKELRNHDYDVDKQDLLLFVSGPLLNDVLAAADRTEVPVPNSTTAVLRLNSIRYAGEDASGLLKFDAEVLDKKYNLTLRVVIVARIVPILSVDKNKLILQVVVENVAPEFQWNCARWRAIGLARRVITAKAQEWGLSQVKVEIPLSHAIKIDVPATDRSLVVPVPAGSITGQLKVPAFKYEDKVEIRTIWLLRDGIHVLVKYGT